jgi:LAS superfamily LD-carboxypeptidase LdcB
LRFSAEIQHDMLNSLELTGRADSHVEEVASLGGAVHRSVVGALTALREAARQDGIDLWVVSSFRGFGHQTAIWNAKFSGERRLLDRQGQPIDPATLDNRALIDAILIWSALPGASRHHWGTDVDVIDRAALPAGYAPQLVQQEFAAGGVFESLGVWLARNLTRFDFFRPYNTDRGGVMPEPWHISYAPVAVPALEALSLEILLEAVATSSMLGRENVLQRLPELYARYVLAVDEPPQPSSAP